MNHSTKLPAMNTGTAISHSQPRFSISLAQYQIAAMPTPYITMMCNRPLYIGLMSALYCSRTLRCFSDIMSGHLRGVYMTDILVAKAIAVKEKLHFVF